MKQHICIAVYEKSEYGYDLYAMRTGYVLLFCGEYAIIKLMQFVIFAILNLK